jgi:hypothetical protein
MIAEVWASWGADWVLNDKVSFDGINKIIYVHEDVTEFNIRTDLYTSWVDWVALYDHTKFLPAIRVTGLDPIGGGVYTGDVYFLINGWKLAINLQTVKVNGVLFSDDYDTAYYTLGLVAQYPATVSSLVTTVETGGGGGATPAEVWSYNNRSLTTAFPTAPTAVQIRQEIDNNSTKMAEILDQIDVTQGLIVGIQGGLSGPQATMLLEMYNLLGLDPSKPLVVTETSRTAGDISQMILTDATSTIVQRN